MLLNLCKLFGIEIGRIAPKTRQNGSFAIVETLFRTMKQRLQTTLAALRKAADDKIATTIRQIKQSLVHQMS